MPLIGVPFEVTLLNRAPEAPQRAPAPPLDENLTALGDADDIRRAERPGPDVERFSADHSVAAVLRGWRRGLGVGAGRCEAAEGDCARKEPEISPSHIVPPSETADF